MKSRQNKLIIMLAKFTPFGKSSSGKTTMLRTLAYIMYMYVDNSKPVYWDNNGSTQVESPVSFSIMNVFSHADFRISFNIIVQKNNETEKSIRIGISTQGDTEEVIVQNWDFFWNRAGYAIDNFIQPDVTASPCSLGRAYDQEGLEQNWHIKHGNMISFVYWLNLPMQDNMRTQLDDKIWDKYVSCWSA